jgi:asparaginyl-tRNA synthetase
MRQQGFVRLKTILAADFSPPSGEITISGWIRTRRESKGVAFVMLNDGSTQDMLQVIVEAGTSAWDKLSQCATGAAIAATGQLRQSLGKGQSLELAARDIHVYGEANPETYPLQKKGHSLEFLREISHLRPRTNTFGAVFRVRNVIAAAIHEFFQSRGFMWVHTPIITASDAEGAGQMFQVTTLNLDKLPRLKDGQIDFSRDFFGHRANLTVSGQLEGELFATAFGDIYTFGPTFRAENSNTTRHLSEFWMIEPEMAFADLSDNMDLAEALIKHLCLAVVKRCPAELTFLEQQYKSTGAMRLQDIEALGNARFHRVTYTDAIKELEKSGKKFEFPVKWGIDMQSEHERFLTDEVFKGPVIVTNYPKDIKAFYMRQDDDGRTVSAMDVLAPRIGEIIGGSQREERLDRLETRMREMKIPVEEMQWYLDTRRFGSIPHAGFGLGFERIVCYLTGMANIRDVIPFPRAPMTIPPTR